MKLWHLCSLVLIAAVDQTPPAPPAGLPSRVVDWTSMETTATKTGQRRLVFDAPTDTLDKLHLHITTLNPGENTGPLHRHPQEEMVIIKEGTIEVNIDGRKQVVGPGSGDLLQRQRKREHDQRRHDAGHVSRHPVVHAAHAEAVTAVARIRRTACRSPGSAR